MHALIVFDFLIARTFIAHVSCNKDMHRREVAPACIESIKAAGSYGPFNMVPFPAGIYADVGDDSVPVGL